jgi:hypothetical protein
VDWATVASVAITGAVGIAGVAGTIAAARIAGKSARESAMLSINAENRRARLADKRQVYAHAIAALDAAAVAADRERHAGGGTQASQVSAELSELSADLGEIRAETSAEEAEALGQKIDALGQRAEALGRKADALNEAFDQADATQNPAWDAVSEVSLIAPSPAVKLARQALNVVLGLRGGRTDMTDFANVRAALFEALRADLEDEEQRLTVYATRSSERSTTDAGP